MKIILCGCGRMGKMVEECALAQGLETVGRASSGDLSAIRAPYIKADALIDFSAPSALPAIAEYVKNTGTPLICGTTGYSEEQERGLCALSEFAPVLHAANFSLGVAVMARVTAEMAQALQSFDIEITEKHHNQKTDAPSGTAKMLCDAADPQRRLRRICGREGMCGKRPRDEIGVHSIRGGTVAGEHIVEFFGQDEELSITHRAADRRIFALGALFAAGRLAGAQKGIYSMQDILFGKGK